MAVSPLVFRSDERSNPRAKEFTDHAKSRHTRSTPLIHDTVGTLDTSAEQRQRARARVAFVSRASGDDIIKDGSATTRSLGKRVRSIVSPLSC